MKKFLAVLLVMVMLLLPVAAHAVDFGSFSGDTDFGDFGGSFDFDFGDYDYGDFDYDTDYDSSASDFDYDTDYDSSASDFGAGVVAGSLIDEIFEDDDDDDPTDDPSDDEGGFGTTLLGFLVIGGIVVLIILGSKKRKRNASKAAPRPAGANITPQSALRPMSEYTQLDPNFDGAELAEKLSNLYVQMQNAWTDKDISPVRPYFTDAIYQQMARQVSMLDKMGRTNYVERIAVLGVTLRGFMQRNGEDHIIAELRTRIVDYTMDDKTGNIISGSQTAEKFMTYEWDISRASGSLTTKGDNMQHVSCPSCGAPLDINATAKCPYCDTVVTLEEHDWAICSIKGISQTTR